MVGKATACALVKEIEVVSGQCVASRSWDTTPGYCLGHGQKGTCQEGLGRDANLCILKESGLHYHLHVLSSALQDSVRVKVMLSLVKTVYLCAYPTIEFSSRCLHFSLWIQETISPTLSDALNVFWPLQLLH